MTATNLPTRWSDKGWTAEVVLNEDGGGWAVAMTKDGHDEPILVVPWVMGRNKKDPKPLNSADFATQLKAAQDYLTRRENQIRQAYRKIVHVNSADGDRVKVVFDVIPDEFEPEGELVAWSGGRHELGRASCPASLKLTRTVAQDWVDGGFEAVHGGDDW
ncbi:MAG: hypothetical protein GY898_15695 [Proteobacteria bacterium]|nr:hypothetical protein [Pseudomonadota bacterium]